MDAISLHAVFAMRRSPTRARRLIRRLIALASVTLSTALAGGSNVRTVTTTPRVCRNEDKLVRRVLSNIFRAAIIHARHAITGNDRLAAIWTSKPAGGVMKERVSGRDD